MFPSKSKIIIDAENLFFFSKFSIFFPFLAKKLCLDIVHVAKLENDNSIFISFLGGT